MASSTFPSSALPPNFTASSPTSKSSSFYEVLGIPMGASLEEIKTAYRKLARVCHPDVAPKDSPADEFLRIQAAYSTLSDPEKRADYDHRVLRSGRRFTTLRTTPNGGQGPVYSRRKWETDQCW
ncbi:hypothetical protein Leryth_012983 [Lithospermum erythrorhizon]|uniref:Chaperone n=1 Tax=Lithospermum erythrorhizon TaxID=34254 RepID=A0AAV3PS95_LITER|nr:hypothetical protein Leryth_012983 [Lithospermum erythrorhizon]